MDIAVKFRAVSNVKLPVAPYPAEEPAATMVVDEPDNWIDVLGATALHAVNGDVPEEELEPPPPPAHAANKSDKLVVIKRWLLFVSGIVFFRFKKLA